MIRIDHAKELFKNWLKDDTENNVHKRSWDEDEEKNNNIFYVNTCHVCHCFDREKRLRRCSSCYLISYCGRDHQINHWPAHRKLCRVVKEIISKNGGPSIFGKTKGLNQNTWTKTKMNAALIVSLKLGRPLYFSETKMFKFPRACPVCHESNPHILTNCVSCGNTSFCKDHILNSCHKSVCPSFVSCYNFDVLKKTINRLQLSEIVYIILNSNVMDFIKPSLKITKSPSMRHFLDTYFRKVINVRQRTSESEYWEDMFISEYFTRAITLISAMEKIGFEPQSEFIVHVLGANGLELEVSAWEIILHWFPKIQKLKIVLIGPELHQDSMMPDLCDLCNYNKKAFVVEFHDVLYHIYMSKGYTKPNLIIGYNLGIHEFINPGSMEDTWKDTILSLPKNDSPFILTAYTENEARKEHERMCFFLGNTTKYFCFEKNNFASLKPHRDFETEGVYYENNYLIIYDELSNAKSEKLKVAKSVVKTVKSNSEKNECQFK